MGVLQERIVAGVPAPPLGSSVTLLDRAVVTDGVHIEPSETAEPATGDGQDDRAARARKLRSRPVPEHSSRKRVVSAVQPQRTPAHAPNRAPLEHKGGQLSIAKDSSEGFTMRTPGFFDDPVGRHELRYWDGHRWTEYVKEHGERFTDPL